MLQNLYLSILIPLDCKVQQKQEIELLTLFETTGS